MSHVELGFLEESDSRKLQSNFFPSKIGSRPAWLELTDLPTPDDLKCSVCQKPMMFLCQVYAPFEEKEECFHRTLFVFVCRSKLCCINNDSRNVCVWRSQIGRVNPYYSSEPPVEDEDFDIGKWIRVCNVCGCLGPSKCSKCKEVTYCSREHQIVDWKHGHKQNCGVKQSQNNILLFPEWEIVTEPEESDKTNKSDSEKEQQQLEEFAKLVAEGKAGTMADIPDNELQSHIADIEDKTFSKFQERIKPNPDQILRYDRNGSPLWVAKTPLPESIPACDYCGGERQFEFQILPQLLYIIKEDDIDWGTLAVYTCKNSCSAPPAYKKEFVFKQDISNNMSS